MGVKKIQVQISFPEKAADLGGSSLPFQNQVLHQLGLLCSRKMILRGSNRLSRNLKSGIRLLRQTARFTVVLPYAELKPHMCDNPVESRFVFNKHQLRYHPLTVLMRSLPKHLSVHSHLQPCEPNHDSRAKSSIMQSAFLKQIKNSILFFNQH